MTKKTLSQFLALDAATCALVFVLGVFATAMVASLTGLPPVVISAAGWICLAAGALFGYLAVRPSRGLLWLAVAGNAAWVAASLTVWVAYAADLTTLGHAVVIAQAIGVAVFVVLEARGAAALSSRPAMA